MIPAGEVFTMRKTLLVLIGALMIAFSAAVAAGYAPAHAEDAQWTASYWNNVKLQGSPVRTRLENTINYNWEQGRPMSGVRADNFSARWTRNVSFTDDTYLFRAISDDGIRVWVDGDLIIDQWYDHSMQTIVVPRDMTAGDHAIKVEYYERTGGAIAKLHWPILSDNPWKVDYYNGTSLTGSPDVTRYENTISYTWNATRPAPGIKANNFSARWVRTQTMAEGKYKFKVTVNGGFRLYLDNKLIMNEWYNHFGTIRTLTRNVDEGDHRIKLEFYNHKDPAAISLSIKPK